MDPLSQGVLGASASMSAMHRRQAMLAALCGLLAGMAPDLDFLIQSDNDPLLYLEYHRQFTHALIFIPVGGLICAIALHLSIARKLTFQRTLLYSTLGYATHGLLDACTTYGTQLFWPFSNTRVAWHAVSIIDPLFTTPILILVIVGIAARRRRFAVSALIWAVVYLSFGLWQGERAEAFGHKLAESRGHQPVRLEAKPSFANLIVWKIIYETEQRYFVDAVRVGLREHLFAGSSVAKLNLERDLPWLDKTSQQASDIERFRWFSNGYLALHHRKPNFIVDMRYSLLPNEIEGLWGIQLAEHANPNDHVDFIWNREVSEEKKQRLKNMLFGSGESPRRKVGSDTNFSVSERNRSE